MRLWSIHPSYLDARCIVATWREGLLARAVLRGTTQGYRHHPQLDRFRAHSAPVSAINNYLRIVLMEATARGYRFDRSLIGPVRDRSHIVVTTDQLAFEWHHLRKKVRKRARGELHRLREELPIRSHPLFVVRSGPIEHWEKGAGR